MENEKLDCMSVCEFCDQEYDRNTESDEIMESGFYMCSKCWDEEVV